MVESIGFIGDEQIPMEKSLSFLEIRRENSPMLDIGVEVRSDGIHRINGRRTDTDGKVNVLLLRHLKNFHPYWIWGRKSIRWSPSDPSDTN